MHVHPLHSDRHRRTEAVMEVLRRRAEQRRLRGQVVPAALRRAIDDYDRHPGPPRPGSR